MVKQQEASDLHPPNGIPLCERAPNMEGLSAEGAGRAMDYRYIEWQLKRYGLTLAYCGVIGCEARCMLDIKTENGHETVRVDTIDKAHTCRHPEYLQKETG